MNYPDCKFLLLQNIKISCILQSFPIFFLELNASLSILGIFLSELHHILDIHRDELDSAVVSEIGRKFKGSLKTFFSFCLFKKYSFY